MVLPERMLQVREGGAWLTTNVVVDPDDGFDGQAPPEPEVRRTGDPALSPASWKTLVGSVARGIRDGQLGLEKVVLARAQQIEQTHPIDLQRALRTLAASYPSCTVFAIAHRDTCFLGATPERLIALHDGTASTVALAGSGPRGATPDEDQRLAEQLLRDPKERAEHAIVVGALRDGLGQVCTRVISDSQPQIRQLANVQHLLTPCAARSPPASAFWTLSSACIRHRRWAVSRGSQRSSSFGSVRRSIAAGTRARSAG